MTAVTTPAGLEKHLNEHFDNTTKTSVPVVFSNSSCEPCKALKAQLNNERVWFIEANVEHFSRDHPEFLTKLGVKQVPTTVIVKHGEQNIKNSKKWCKSMVVGNDIRAIISHLD